MPVRLILLALLGLLLPAQSAAAAEYVPGEVVVGYEDGGSRTLTIRDGDSVRETVAELRADPHVAYAAPNVKARAAAFTPNDPAFARQWHLFDFFGTNMPEAWSLAADRGAPGGRGAVVAVLDSGVAFETRGRFRRAPDLRRRTFVHPYDFIDDDRHPNDIYGHGTHIAGTIAQATHNRRGAAGIAYGAKIMPLRVLGSDGYGNSAIIARAIRYAVRHRADVINLSLEFLGSVRGREIPGVIKSLRFANRRGVVVTGAAGNQADPRVAYPARAEPVIAVGATTHNGCQAEYSNTGHDLDLMAPGGGLDALSRDPTDQAFCNHDYGKPIYQVTFTRGLRRFGIPPDFEGTSMSSPQVAAIAALVIATKRLGDNPSPALVEQHLEATARDLGPPGPDPRYGAGLVDAAAALR
jgi:serine protease